MLFSYRAFLFLIHSRREYCEELHGEVDDNDEVIAVSNYGKEPPPLKSEISRAMQQTNSRKAAGLDGIPVELFKAGGDATLDRLHEICTLVWETGEWPQD